MAKIAFIGLGNMGGPMAANLVKGQHQVMAFDLSDAAVKAAVDKGASKAASAAEAVKSAEVVVTMLPAGKHVREVYEKDVLPNVGKGTLLIDCSTIDVESARHVAGLAEKAGLEIVDAPVSGGVGGATAGTLTFMVGGSDAAFAKARPILEKMGKNIVHAGTSGGGQAAKICNNMILGVSMIAVGEAFLLAKRLGLDAQKLFDVASTSSGQCWALTSYCPVPGPVPTSPANRDYQAGFTAAMMLKDLMLAQQAAQAAGASTPLGAEAAQLFNLFVNSGHGAKDFSGIIRMLDGK
jgi:3-hydroxyisobutyrate dehydrogenase